MRSTWGVLGGMIVLLINSFSLIQLVPGGEGPEV